MEIYLTEVDIEGRTAPMERLHAHVRHGIHRNNLA
jgi:hypothetical protein